MVYEDLLKEVERQKVELEQLKAALTTLTEANSYMVFAIQRLVAHLPGADELHFTQPRLN
jgi:cell division septum initiation protein DivIVA